jgi:hypothetical protein
MKWCIRNNAQHKYLDRFPSEYHKVFGSHHHKAHELVAQNLLNFISLDAYNTKAVRALNGSNQFVQSKRNQSVLLVIVIISEI